VFNSLITLHSYLIFNSAIAIGYIISRTVLRLFNIKINISQKQHLIYARVCFFIPVVAFLFMPYVLSVFPFSYRSSFQLIPIFKSASASFLEPHKIINHQINQLQFQYLTLSIHHLLICFLILGVGIFLIQYIKNIFVLLKLQRASYCHHKINKIHVLINDKTELPFCWSLFRSHYIVLPQAMLQTNEDMKLAIRHELQHIRQGDTHWLHIMTLIKSLCFWNPFIKLWINWLAELQEYSCDESIVLMRKISLVAYAECLVNAANRNLNYNAGIPQGVLGIHGSSKSILYRRVDMLFNYQHHKVKKLSIIAAYIFSLCLAVSTAFALNGSTTLSPLTKEQVNVMIKKSDLDKDFQVTATPEVINEINNIRSSNQARSFMHESLQRMNNYKPVIQAALNKESMPTDLLVIPLVESGYQPLDQSKNNLLAAGIWQIVPSTAKRFDLTINHHRDDRLNTQLSTKAALSYLKANYAQFQDWKLASIAYEIGAINTERLIKETGSRDAWVLARSPFAPGDLKRFLAMLDAELIIMHNPSLID